MWWIYNKTANIISRKKFFLEQAFALSQKSRHFSIINQDIVSRGDWLWKLANIKVENNVAVVYDGSSLTVHNPLFLPDCAQSFVFGSQIVTE